MSKLQLKNYSNYLSSIVSGIMLACAYPPMPASMVFCAILGLSLLLYSTQNIDNIWSYFGRVLMAMLIWNIITIYWIINSTLAGGIFTIIANSLLYTFPFLCLYWARRLWKTQSWGIFICAFLAFEFFHFHWEIHFPWLTLGHALSANPALIQWYSITGVAGGSLWLLAISIFLVQLINTPRAKTCSIAIVVSLLIPSTISLIMRQQIQYQLQHQQSAGEIIIVQPNIEAYTEKFILPAKMQIDKFFKLCEGQITPQTRYLLFPETALPELYWEDKDSVLNDKSAQECLQLLKNYLSKYPQLTLVTGLNSCQRLNPQSLDPAKRYLITHNNDTLFYASYNTVALVNAQGFQAYYHKSKLVPGVESVPYAKYLGFMQNFTVDLGGITGTLGTDSVAHNLQAGSYNLAAIICYESIYGDYVSQFCQQNAQAICVLTNDGWWGNTAGYRQHAQYGTLRAIENRKYIYRSANTGISYICDPSGEILQSIPYEQAGIIRSAFIPLNSSTFYNRNPFLIYTISSIALGIYILIILSKYLPKIIPQQPVGKKNEL